MLMDTCRPDICRPYDHDVPDQQVQAVAQYSPVNSCKQVVHHNPPPPAAVPAGVWERFEHVHCADDTKATPRSIMEDLGTKNT